MEEKKRCSKCKKTKLLTEFHKAKNDKYGYHHYCKKCLSDQKKKRYKTNLEYRTRRKSYQIQRKYGLTENDILSMIKGQDNKCEICDKEFKSRRTTFIDHNHTTGKVRGLLCPKCNNLLSACYDNIDILKSAILYIEKTAL